MECAHPHRRRRIAGLASALFALGALAAPVVASAAVTPAKAAGFRLGDAVEPTREDVRLTIDPSVAEYSGDVVIELVVRRATRDLRLHAEAMTLGRTALVAVDAAGTAKGGPIALVPVTGENGLLALRAARALKPGPYRLTIAFTNDFNTQATSLYRLESGGDWYAFTQFEADDAREAFPCFDEPGFKIPWNLTVTARAADLVVGNSPIASEQSEGRTKTVVFKTTKPLPSYLIAIAVGPLETVPIEGLAVPGRVVTVKGASHLAGEAARITPMLVAALESYFGRPYPYEKLDLVAVPEFWPGAMENAGQITFADRLLLIDPARASTLQRQTQASVTAHELAHMWFGDLVTMEWWDDLWLNESFASWMGEKVLHQVFPEFGTDLSLVADSDEAMRRDGTLTTRAIRQPVTTLANLLQSADVLAYKKGQTLLGMFETWAGEEAFRTGVRNYLSAHAWGNATAADLFAALSSATGKDVAGPMATFLEQPGMPLVTVEPLEGGRVRLSQERLLPSGATRPPPQTWKIPLTLKYGDGTAARTKNVLLTAASEVIDLDAKKIDWIAPNGGAGGYYRWKLPPRALVALADDAPRVLEPRERMEYAYAANALLDAGALHADAYLQLLPRFLRDPEPMVVSAALDGMQALKEPLVTPDVAGPFARWVREAVGPALERFGRTQQEGEKETVGLLRPRLLTALADEGQDPPTRAFGDSVARAYLANPAAVDPGLALPALRIAAYEGNLALRETIRAKFETAEAPAERRTYLTALGAFRDPKLVDRNLEYALAGPLKPQEISSLLTSVAGYAPNRDRSWGWIQDHYDALVKRIPPMYGAFLPLYAGGCSSERREKANAFFADPAHAPPGAAKELARMSEGVDDCLELREREGSRFKAWLTRSIGDGQVP
jgi:alanyl aminopeptidase